MNREPSYIILIGGGGHCKSCIDVIELEQKYTITGIIDRQENVGRRLLGYPIIGTDADLPGLIGKYENFLITLGQILNPARRIEIFDLLLSRQAHLPVIVSPRAYVSRHATIGVGTIVMHDVIINAAARIGRNCIINNKALIEHDAVIDDHCHISTAAVLNGGAQVAPGTFIGSNATIREMVSIGHNSVIGAGVRVMKSIAANSVVSG